MQVAEAEDNTTASQPKIVMPPSLKLIVPVGNVPLTVAVKVIVLPTWLGLALLITAVLEMAYGVMLFDGDDAEPVPIILRAVTLQVTATPMLRPLTVIGDDIPVLLWLAQVVV